MKSILSLAMMLACLACQATGPHESNTLSAEAHAEMLYANVYGDLSRPTFVFLHGGPGYNSFDFEFSTAIRLANAGYGVVVYDQLGSGRSQAGTLDDYTFARATADLRQLISYFHLTKPILIGHSFGGTIGLQFIDRYPGVAAGLILAGSPISYPDALADSLDACVPRFEEMRFAAPIVCTTQNCRDRAYYLGRLNDTMRLRAEMFVGASHQPREFNTISVSEAFGVAGECGLYRPRQMTQEALGIEQFLRTSDTIGLMGANAANQTEDGSPFLGFMRNEGTELGMGYAHLDLGHLVTKHKASIFGIYGTEDGLFGSEHLNRIRSLMLPGRMTMVEGASHAIYVHRQLDFINSLRQAATVLHPE